MTVLGERLTWMWLVVLALATVRLARFVTRDDYPLWAPLRARITRRWPPRPGAWSEVVLCPWCCSPYLGAALLVAWLFVPYWLAPVAVILALSAVAGLLAEWGGRMAGLGSVTVSCPCCGSGITAPLTGTMLPLRSADGTAVVEVSANIDHTCPPTPERKAS